MKTIQKLTLFMLSCSLLWICSCSDSWNHYYSQHDLSSDGSVEIFQGSLSDYLSSQASLSRMHDLFQDAKVFERMNPRHEYTLIVYPNELLAASSADSSYALYCVSDVAVPPAALHDGLGLATWFGKNVWVYEKAGRFCIDDYPIAKMVQTRNGFIYLLEEGMVPVRQSLYDELMALDDADYSLFKSLVKRYEQRYFDPSKCQAIGTNSMGNTIYADSAKGWTTRNYVMDRYTEDGLALWDMRSENYSSTLLVPSNDVLKAAIDTALAKVPRFLRRKATSSDRAKFEKWILTACFIDQRLEADQITGTADIDCVGGFTRDTLEGKKTASIDAAMWRPTVQKVRTNDAVRASNGNLYFIDYLKVPNNVIIYRLKARFYELWNNMTADQRNQYFSWNHWIDPMVLNDAQGEFTLSETLPTMYYHVLTAIPDEEARKNKLPCSVTYKGVLYNESNNRGERIQECYIPAGEYYLRMGFKHSLIYSLSIQFNDTMLIEDMVMYAQGSNYHFDRGSVSVNDYYGVSSIGYPEGYNWKDWSSLSEKAQAYDTDGYQVGIVTVPEDGNFTITITSNDMSSLYDYSAERNTHNIKQLMMYHWCLRPTKNNY